jgi:coenzyme F420 hydrogenase subunit beta
MSKRLEAEVWALENCSGCGLCVSVCSKQVLKWNGKNHPRLEKPIKKIGYTKQVLDSCSFCNRFCEEVCPRLEHLVPLDAEAILGAKTNGPVKTGTPNGVILAILVAGRSTGLIDGVVMNDFDPWVLQPKADVASTVEDIAKSVGPQYIWAPTLDALNSAIYDWGLRNLAVVGTPCVAQAIRRLINSTETRLKTYQEAIRLVISVFCTGMYKPELIEEEVVKKLGVPRNTIRGIEESVEQDGLKVKLWDGGERIIIRQQAEAFTRPGCGSCDDYLGSSADIAIGNLGTPQDSSTLLINTNVGDIFVRNALKMRLLETFEEVNLEALELAKGEKSRRERAQAFKINRLLMLDALAEPLKRGEAVQQFTRLYRTPVHSQPQNSVRNGCTGC